MKRWIILISVLSIIVGLVHAESVFQERFRINGVLPVEMSVQEIYDLEDTIVSALVTVFYRDAEELSNGELFGEYVINPKTKKFHYPWCYSALEIGPDRIFIRAAPTTLVQMEFVACGKCKPHVNGEDTPNLKGE